MSWVTDVQDEVVALVDTTWSSLETIQRSAVAERLSWRRLVEAVESSETPSLSLPMAVVDFGRREPSMDYGDCNDAYEWPIDVYLIVGLPDSNFKEKEAELQGFAWELEQALKASVHDHFTVITTSTTTGQDCPPNDYFVKTHLPYMAVQISFRAITGESA